jgi:hypothetical protein
MIPKKFQKDRRSICLISTMSEVPPFIRRDKNMLIEKLFSFGRNESTLGKTQTTSRKSIMESLECRRLMSGSGILEWPSSSQNILSVGGTTLSASPTGTDSTESGWADSGGGLNRFEFEASYDSTVQNTDVRTTPDGAVPANPFGVFAVYDSNAYKGQSGWFEVGGTSAGVPQWASLIAIADQTGAANGLTALSASPVLSSLYVTVTNASSSTLTSASATLAVVGKTVVSPATDIINSSTLSISGPSLDSALPVNPAIIALTSSRAGEIDMTPMLGSDTPSVLDSFRSPGLMLALDNLHASLEMASQAINVSFLPSLISEVTDSAISAEVVRPNDAVQSFSFPEALASFGQLTAEPPSGFERGLFNNFMSIGTGASALFADSPISSLLNEQSVAQTWEVAAAACLAGTVAAWWWTDESRADRSVSSSSPFTQTERFDSR